MHLTTEFPPLIYGGLGTAVGALAAASARCGIEVSILLIGAPGPDVLHLHSFWLWPVAEAIRHHTGAPIVYTVHSLDRAEYEIGQGPPECLTQWHIQERAIATADAIVALTRAERDLVNAYVPGSWARVHVVGNGIDVAKVSLDSIVPRQRACEEVTVLFSGRFVERKGVRELLAAVPRVLRHRPNVRIVLAGGYRGCDGEDLARRWLGPELEPYRDRLHFPGWLDSEAMATWYAKADILVVPSWYEPFGMVVLEGMLHGLAIAASDIGGPREILEDERTGLLFPPRDSIALGEVLCRLADSQPLRVQLGRAAAECVRKRWSYDKVVRQMSDVYSFVARHVRQ